MLVRVWLQFIARNLLAQKTVVRFVRVEGAHDVIAVAPRTRPRFVGLEAVALRPPREVEPEASPTFAKSRRGQQPIHQSLVRRGRVVRFECRHFLRRRRQAGQIKRDAANERKPIRFGQWMQSKLGVLDRKQDIDRVGRRQIVLGRSRRDWTNRGSKCPVPLGGFSDGIVRPRRTGGDPVPQNLYLGLGQTRPLGRHPRIGIVADHTPHRFAFLRPSGHECRPRFAAAQCGRFLVEPESTLLFALAMTLRAMRGEHGLHVAQEIHRDRRQPCRHRERREQCSDGNQPIH